MHNILLGQNSKFQGQNSRISVLFDLFFACFTNFDAFDRLTLQRGDLFEGYIFGY